MRIYPCVSDSSENDHLVRCWSLHSKTGDADHYVMEILIKPTIYQRRWSLYSDTLLQLKSYDYYVLWVLRTSLLSNDQKIITEWTYLVLQNNFGFTVINKDIHYSLRPCT